MIVRTTLGRDGQKAGSAGGHPAVLAGEGSTRAGTVSPTPQEDLDLPLCAEDGRPEAHGVGGMPVRRGEGRQAFCPDLGITVLHRKSREKIRLSPGLM